MNKIAVVLFSGLGYGYDQKEVEVTTDQGSLISLMYFATRVNPALKPYRWYKEHVLVGARVNWPFIADNDIQLTLDPKVMSLPINRGKSDESNNQY
ncbi:hypothetical protein ACU6RQ_09845 [Zobellella denitrificans]